MNIVAICALALITSVIAVTLKRYNGEMSLMVAIAGCIFIFLSLLSSFTSLYDTVNKILSSTGINVTYITVLLKAVGICFVTEFACDCCKDAGQNALASNVSVAGKIMVLVTAIPLYNEILQTVLSLTGGAV